MTDRLCSIGIILENRKFPENSMIDYHVHTPFCNHAVGSMAQYVQHAMDAGLAQICFLDHLTVSDHEKGLSMAPDEVPFYFQAAKLLARQYRDRIDVRVGLEIDFNPDRLDILKKVVSSFDFDVIACSIHFIDGQNIVSRKSEWARGQGDAARLCRQYLDILQEILLHDWFDVIGHLDVMKKFANALPDPYIYRMENMVQSIRESGKTVEVNTSGLDHAAGEIYPAPNLLRLLFQAGVPITIGSDAHKPGEVARNFERATGEILSAGYRTLTAFDRRCPVEFPLNTAAPETLKTEGVTC
jgi:histidinol-phosphatase (PHP family)